MKATTRLFAWGLLLAASSAIVSCGGDSGTVTDTAAVTASSADTAVVEDDSRV